ncbi:MAG: hypothetical protein M1374_04865 [Firmicutes bacterium]|jgi:flagellar hook-associated protein 3 FlgL|nr:hypothetical protein [Bacillota bacterium]
MRITDLTLTNQLSGSLQSQEQTINNLDNQLGSGTSLLTPSSNPIAVSNVLNYQNQLSQVNAQQNNVTTAQSWLGLANGAASQTVSVMQQIQSTVLQALNSGVNNAQTYNSMAQQVQGAVKELLGLANTSYGQTQIFAGTASVSQAFSATGAYNGNATAFTIDVGSGSPVAASVPGDQLFGGGTSGIQSIFTTIQNIVTNLQAGPGAASYAGLQSDMTALTANLNQAGIAADSIGESLQQVNAASTANQSTSTELQTAISNLGSVNIPSVSTTLQADLTSYQAALYAVSKAVPETLAQFIN